MKRDEQKADTIFEEEKREKQNNMNSKYILYIIECLDYNHPVIYKIFFMIEMR